MKKNLVSLLTKSGYHLVWVAVVFLIPILAFAQSTGANDAFVPLTNIPGLTSAGNAPTLPAFLNQLYKICIGAAAVIAILQIMRAGFMFMTNKGSVSGNEQAKSLISQSILGLVLVLSPVIVFGIINPDILKLDLDVSGLQSGATATSVATSTTATTTSPNYVNPNTLSNSCALTYSETHSVPSSGTSPEDASLACTTYGSGFAPAAASCCANLTTGNVCCGKTNSVQLPY